MRCGRRIYISQRAERNDLAQPHMNVVTSEYPLGVFAESGDFGGGSRGEDIPWQGPTGGAASTVVNTGPMACAPQVDAGEGGYRTAYYSAYAQQEQHQQQPQEQRACSGGGETGGRGGAE